MIIVTPIALEEATEQGGAPEAQAEARLMHCDFIRDNEGEITMVVCWDWVDEKPEKPKPLLELVPPAPPDPKKP